MTTETAPAAQPAKAAPAKKLGKTAKGKANKRTSARKSAKAAAKRAARKADGKGSRETPAAALLSRKGGATLPEICKAFGWQKHSARGFISILGSKREYKIESSRVDGVRTYKIK